MLAASGMGCVKQKNMQLLVWAATDHTTLLKIKGYLFYAGNYASRWQQARIC